MPYDGAVRIKINGDDTDFKKAINSTSSSLEGLKGLIVKLGLGAVLAKGMKDGIQATNAFEDSIAKASTLFGDTAVNIEGLNTKITELSSSTGVSADRIGSSLYNALSAGVAVTEDMGEAMAFMEANTKLSIAGFTDIDTAVSATSKVLNAYGKDVIDIDEVSKVLMTTQNLGITTVDQLGSALATVTPVASAFGLSFQQVGASLAVMTKAGTDTATATTQLRAVLNALAQNGTKASKALTQAWKSVHGEAKSFAELNKEGVTLQEMLRTMETYAKSSNLSLMDLFGEVRAGTGALQLASDATGTYTKFLEEMKGDADVVGEAYDKVMNTRSKRWEQITNRLRNISIKITNADATQRVLDNLTNFAENFIGKLENWLPELTATVDQFSFYARIALASIQHAYDESFLKKGVDFAIRITDNQLKSIIDDFKSGDLFGAVAKVTETGLMVSVGLRLIKTGLGSVTALTSEMSAGISKIGWLGIGASALELAMGVKWAMDTGDWETFSQALLLALIPATIAGAFLGVSGGAMVFAIAFKLLRGMKDNTVEGKTTRELNDNPEASSHNVVQSIKTTKEAKKAIEEETKSLKEFYDQFNIIKNALNSNMAFQDKLKEALSTDVGRNTVAGMLEGMDEPIDQWSDKFCAHVIQALRNSLDIHSPSEVAKDDVGYWIGMGIAEGIWNTDTEQAVNESVKKIMDKIVEATKNGDISFGVASRLYAPLLAEGEKAKANIKPAKGTLDFSGVISDFRESLLPTSSTGTGKSVAGEDFFNAMSKSMGYVMEDCQNLSQWFQQLTDDEGNLTDRGQFWADTMSNALNIMAQGFSEFGEALANGEASWGMFAKAGLNALASIVEALAYQLLGQAVSAYPDFAQMAKAGAMSALMLTASGFIRGMGNSFERGGIVGGSGYTGDKHMIWANAGELILSRSQQKNLAGQLGGTGSAPVIHIDFSGQVFGDQQSISEFVYEGIRTAQHNGVLAQWQ